MPSLGQEGPLEKGMATHSSSLAWRIPWAEEPGGYSPWDCKKSDTAERLTLSQVSFSTSLCLSSHLWKEGNTYFKNY